MVIHTAEKEFKCDVCGKQFYLNNNYFPHIKNLGANHTHLCNCWISCNVCLCVCSLFSQKRQAPMS